MPAMLVLVGAMVSALLSVRTFLIAIFMLMAGSGFLSTLIAVRLDQAGASAAGIALVTTSYFAGLTLGSLVVSNLIARVGHIRAFAAFVSLFSASSLTYAVLDDFFVWTGLRFIDGLVMAGVFICLESWLNQQAKPSNRSSILASYMVALYMGQAAGQFLLNLNEQAPALPFMFSAILLSLSLLPVVLTRMDQPVMERLAPFSLRRLYAISPLGIVGVLATGVMLGAFYALGAVYVRRLGMDMAGVALFTSCVIAGGVVLQWPLGLLSDRFDRRRIIVACFIVTAAICAAMAMNASAGWLLFLLGGLFGGFAFALYPLCVAHSNDHIEEDERVGASGGLVLMYSLGAAAGPMLGSAGMAAGGPPGLFAIIGAIAVITAFFAGWRMLAAKPVPSEGQQPFQSIPRTTPMVAVLNEDE